VNDDHAGSPGERELLGRPFLDWAAHLPPEPEPHRDPHRDSHRDSHRDPVARLHNDIRPYLMTGGRTVAAAGVPAVAMETVVVLSRLARNGPAARQAFERDRILRECRRPCSVAEVAARLRFPLGVAIVLITDLIADGLLDASAARREEQAYDVQFLERLIAGVSAL
jgi:hypothetical protein